MLQSKGKGRRHKQLIDAKKTMGLKKAEKSYAADVVFSKYQVRVFVLLFFTSRFLSTDFTVPIPILSLMARAACLRSHFKAAIKCLSGLSRFSEHAPRFSLDGFSRGTL